ncbi:MAG: SigE family RNA polymerase sigma factor [Streptosporangiales bacterium]|nr:SigE family RNA polymerase sigma factor [Streptosporangiales bacterium]
MVESQWEADEAVTELYGAHYRSLVRLAVLLVRDLETAEDIVQDAFVAMHGAWRRLRDQERALPYLRQAVVNKARSALRRRKVEIKYAPNPGPDAPSAEYGAIGSLERDTVLAALDRLPVRQRETLILRYYSDLSEAQIAEAMGISRGSVKSHAARAMAAMRELLDDETVQSRVERGGGQA